MEGSLARRVRRRARVAPASSSRPSMSRTRRSSSSMRAGFAGAIFKPMIFDGGGGYEGPARPRRGTSPRATFFTLTPYRGTGVPALD